MNASKKLAALVGVILLSGMIFTGCSGNGQESSQTSSASVSSETETSSVHSQSDFNSAAEAESNAQSAAVSPNSSTSSQNNTDFDEYFSQNPITAAHNEESGSVYTTNDMLQVEEKFAGIWAKEVDHAYELCQQNLPSDIFSSVKADHETWLSTQHADLADIRADGQQAGGTLGSVQIATDSAAYYEKEAKKLYQVLYENNISYQYQFEDKTKAVLS